MSKCLFITGTGTDVGKTYVTALLVKKLREAGLGAGYYKAALSGADSIENSDAGYVRRIAGISQQNETLLSYLYQNAVSPHLAARLEGNPVNMEKVIADFASVCSGHDYVTVEGSGGIVCPVRYDETAHILLEDIIKTLGLCTLMVADAGLGAINAAVLTAEYLRNHGIGVKGVIINNYTGGAMQEDNIRMIEALAKLPVLAAVKPNASEIDISADELAALYE